MPNMNWNFLFVVWMFVVGLVVGAGWTLGSWIVSRILK
jgi:hypothetical protein